MIRFPDSPGVQRFARLLLLVMAGAANTHAQDDSSPNILVIIGDDMGVETVASFGVGTHTPTTATLDALAERGLSFSNMWAQPVCSPTRATILTGRYGFRTGVGRPTGDGVARGDIPEPLPVPRGVVEFGMGAGMGGGFGMGGESGMGMGRGSGELGGSWGITLDEFTLTQAFNTRPDLGYDKAAIGKWHLADTRNGWENHPNLIGFDHFSGLIRCCVESYFSWVKLVNGEFSTETGYAVSDKVDDAIEWLGETAARDDPWFLWLAFNTPHTPIHMPPRELLQSDYSQIALDDLEQDTSLYFDAMIEAMDTEIGRLLDHIGSEVLENTYVLFIGDNGTGSNVVRAPFRTGHAKGTVYNGGVAVPFLIAGPGVDRGQTSDALVNSTDLYATILEMAGIEMTVAVPADITLVSVSLMPYLSAPSRDSIRDWIYVDAFRTEQGVKNGEYAISNGRFKFLVDEGVEHFFDLQADPYEYDDLLSGDLSAEQQEQYEALRARVNAMHDSEV